MRRLNHNRFKQPANTKLCRLNFVRKSFPNNTFTLAASGGASGNPVTFTTTTPTVCSVTGNVNNATVTLLTGGLCTMAVDQGYSAAAQVTQSFAITAPPRKLYYVHADHLGTPRAITDSTTNTKVWEWGNEDAFGNNLPNEDPLNTGVATKYNLRFPGQYYDLETNTHYNYFRDYDPGTGRYVQSDPIGLNGGFSTYAYVGGRPVASIDPLGWLEKCRKIIEDEWRKIARGEKIVDYKSLGLANDLLGALINAATNINPGMSAGMKIPIYQDVQLNRLFKVTVEVCVDDCTGKETARRKLREKGIDQYQEVFFNGTREGAPDYAGPDPSFETRWGYGKLPRS